MKKEARKKESQAEYDARKEREKQALQEELGWECTCRWFEFGKRHYKIFFPESGLELTYSRAKTLVMEMRGRGRGRGFRGGRGRGMLRNIKHQAHCKELERIRERGREMREKKQAAWEERRRVRLEREKELGVEEKSELTETASRRDENEDSSSEDEGWCEGVPAFKGTLSVVIEQDKVEEGNLLISDDEDQDKPVKAVLLDEGEMVEATRKQQDDKSIAREISHQNNVESVNVCDAVENADSVREDINVHDDGKASAHEDQHSEDNNSDVEETVGDIEEDSSDEAPEEIKIVKSYENEDPGDEKSSLKSSVCNEKSKSSRKRKRKPKKDGEVKEAEEDVEHTEKTTNIGRSVSEKVEPRTKFARQSVLEQRLRPPTLLEKLLLQVEINSYILLILNLPFQEIKKERNTILQCVRYVCKNNFFEAKKST